MAGEVLTLATLVVNADGTIVAYNRAGQAAKIFEKDTTNSVNNAERKTKSAFEEIGLSSKRLADGFLNTRRIIQGLFLGFSVGGIVLQMSELIQAQITSTNWWKSLKETANDYFQALVAGETPLENIARKSTDLATKAGITTVESIEAKMKGVNDFIDKEMEKLNEKVAFNFFGKQISFPPNDEQIRKVTTNVAEARKVYAGLEETLKKLGVTAKKTTEALPGTNTGAGPEFLTEPQSALGLGGSNKDFSERFNAFQIQEIYMQRQMDDLRAGVIAFDEYSAAIDRSVQRLKELGFSQEQISQTSGVMYLNHLQELQSNLDHANSTLEKMNYIFGAIASTASAAADAGILSQKRLFQITQALLSVEAAQRAIIAFASAAFALASGNAGSAALYYTAGALYSAAAAFHGVAALKGPQGSSSGGGGGGLGGRDTFTEQSTRLPAPRDVTIQIVGGIWPGTPEEIARTLRELLKQAEADGVA